jgi:fatty acid desaturase
MSKSAISFVNLYKKVMKPTAISLSVITTLVLITVAIFAALDFSFGWVFFLTLVGQILLVFTVFKVLKDDYSTTKTFEDFYEDNPVGRK